MSDPIPVVVDIPSPEPGLGFDHYAAALADAIRGGDPPQFTVGLYGSWGSGKSTLLRAISRHLEDDPNVICVFFDAWRYERSEHIVVPLLHEVHRAVAATGNQEVLKHVRRALESLVFSLNFKLSVVGVDMKKIRDTWEDQGLPRLDLAFAEPFEALQRIPAALHGRRIAIFIDDLDRCSPEKVVSVLEAINVVMDVHGLIFVLALDYEVLMEAVRQQYPHVREPHVFVEKMVQLPFRVPPLDIRRPDFLHELVPHLQRQLLDLDESVITTLVDIANFGLQRNPRQLKRLLNTFMLARRIAALRSIPTDDDILLATLGLQLRWPEDYRRLYQAVINGTAAPLDALRTQPGPDLERYIARFFDDAFELLEQLRRILEFTTALSEPEAGIDVWDDDLED